MSKSARDQFLAQLSVPRETVEKLERYAAMLTEWQSKINLVSATTLPNLWTRHLLDSAQLYRLLPAGTQRMADLGSGAGFPGLVLAIMGVPEMHLIESDQRKSVFLREVARATETKVTVHANRIEDVPPLHVDVVSARALAPLSRLIPLAYRHLKAGGQCLFLKGAELPAELQDASKDWQFEAQESDSLTSAQGRILQLGRLAQKTELQGVS